MYMVTEGKKRPITCPECECRLRIAELFEDVAIAYHFLHESDPKRDAQSHLCSSIGTVWNLKFENPKIGKVYNLVPQQ